MQPECKQVHKTKQHYNGCDKRDGMCSGWRRLLPIPVVRNMCGPAVREENPVSNDSQYGHRGVPGLKSFCFERQSGLCKTIVVASLDIADLSLRLLKLRLAEFDNRAQAHVVARLREREPEICLLQ